MMVDVLVDVMVASLVDELVASMDELPVGWMVVVMAASSDACSVARWVGR